MSKKSKQPKKSTVTILTVKQIYRRSILEPSSELTLAFVSRERAIDAIKLHLANPDANTTINIRTLDVI